MKIYGTILFALSLLSQKNHKTQVKKLHKFILKMYLGPLIGTFFVAVFVLLMQFLWKYIDDLVGKGLEWYIITELLFYASATFVPMALPLAVLLSSIMTFGNLGERYELVALKASGISLQKIIALP
jgi:lipopolysaccharide export system permease protein